MKNLEIIADSGGTKTDWIVSDEKGVLTRITTESYHPRNISADFINRNRFFWSEIENVQDYRLQFYGSGCLKEENALKMKEALAAIGFIDPQVLSDLDAAAKALKIENGWGAICGTGSVVFNVSNGKIIEIRGGLGRELGDEGSGYYFGKILAKAVLKDEISIPFISKKELNDENCYSTFTNRFAELKFDEEIYQLHCQNIQALIENQLEGIKTICFVGSYAFHHQFIFNSVLMESGIKSTNYIERPIEILAI